MPAITKGESSNTSIPTTRASIRDPRRERVLRSHDLRMEVISIHTACDVISKSFRMMKRQSK